jgi:6-methylsalicylate decarboxylase
MKIDVHQHLWTERLIEALAGRSELPFVRREQELNVLFLAGERPYVIDLQAQTPARRAALVGVDGLDGALICLSSPLGIESLPHDQAQPLIDAYHQGALALGEPFGVWGAVAIDAPNPVDIDQLLDRGCVGVSLPAGALGSVERVGRLGPLLARLEARDAPLLIHPGPGARSLVREPSLCDPLWWPALTRYVAEMQAAWLAFTAAGRRGHPRLRVVFTMLAGLAPLQIERLASRGGPRATEVDPLTFYDTSSYGPRAVRAMAEAVGAEQLVYGSDRPVLDPDRTALDGLDWGLLADNAARALATPGVEVR